MSENHISTRKAALEDINELCRLYMELPPKVRRMFHPFPFHPTRLKLVFIAMLTGQTLLGLYKRVMPRLGFVIFVAEDATSGDIHGFIYLRLLGKERGKLIANIGIVTREGLRSRGIGSTMYDAINKYSLKIGVAKYRSIIIEENIASLSCI